EVAKTFMDTIAADRLRVGTAFIYRLPALPPSLSIDPGPQLATQSVTANSSEENVRLMLDGNVATRWESLGHQTEGQEIRIRLGRVATISRVELDLGKWHLDYPRRLRVDVANGA